MSERKTARARERQPRRKQVRYSQQLAETICARLSAGEAWHRMCEEDGMPSYAAFYAWRRRYPAFAQAVEAALQAAADYYADRALEVAQAATKETVTRDRLEVSTLLTRAKTAKAQAQKAEAAAASKLPPIIRYVFEARRFETVTGEDGKLYVREIPPEPSK